MRTLEEIKKRYLFDPHFNHPSKEEIEYYSLNDEIYKEWIIDKLSFFKMILYKKIEKFKNNLDSNSTTEDMVELFSEILDTFEDCMNYYPATYSYYFSLPELLKEMYDKDLFDYVTYEGKDIRTYRFANFVYYVRPLDYGMTIEWHRGKKYTGMLIQVYYNNPKVFEELLLYFANTIYQKYGLYLQYDMNILIQFCYEYNLPYLDLLYDAHKKAMEFDYPANHEFKYQLEPRKDIKWEENVLKLRTIDELKDDYLNNTNATPTKHEKEYYKITDEVLKEWLKEKK